MLLIFVIKTLIERVWLSVTGLHPRRAMYSSIKGDIVLGFSDDDDDHLCVDNSIRNGTKKKGHGWKLNRTSYYQEGWLAAGNNRSVVGVTFTSTLPHRNSSLGVNPPTDNEISGSLPLPPAPPHLPLPPRTNYNLRGHRAQVSSNWIEFQEESGMGRKFPEFWETNFFFPFELCRSVW